LIERRYRKPALRTDRKPPSSLPSSSHRAAAQDCGTKTIIFAEIG
jgi:hypothetical protein